MSKAPGTNDDATPLATLLERAAQGDEAAFERLYDDTVPRVYGLVLRVVRDPALAEDVTRRVFVEAWRQAGRYDASRTSVLAWLMTSAHLCAVTAAREAETTPTSGPSAAAADVVPTPRSARVEEALSTLATDEREALDLAWGSGYTHREIARLLGAGPGAVTGLIRAGLLRLGRELAAA